MLKATAVRSPQFVYVCLKSGSQLACQAPGALPCIDTIHGEAWGTTWGFGDNMGAGDNMEVEGLHGGVGQMGGDNIGTSGPGCLYRTTTGCLPSRDFAQLSLADVGEAK